MTTDLATAAATITRLCARFCRVDHGGGLTEEDPLIVRLPRTPGTTLIDPYIQLWLYERESEPSILRMVAPIRVVSDHHLDLDQLAEWALEQNPRFLFGTLQVWSTGKHDSLHHLVQVTHSVAIDGLTQQTLESTLRCLGYTWRRCRQGLGRCIRRPANEADAMAGKRSSGGESVLGELDRLVGLAPVKAMVRTLAAQQQVAAHRRAAGLKVPPISPHLVFTGNPGTGKTTVARLVGQLYQSVGLLEKGHVVSVDRSSLVAGYLGQTALRTKEACEKALGGVLFIDEAYSLVVDGRDYGSEAIEALLTFMEDHRGEIVVIVAGYPGEMHRFLDSNPGLRSRFDMTIDFPDYSDHELVTIFEGLASEHDYVLDPGARAALHGSIAALPRGDGFGNARSIRSLFNTVVCNHAALVARRSAPTRHELRTITAAALPAVSHAEMEGTSPRSTARLHPGYL